MSSLNSSSVQLDKFIVEFETNKIIFEEQSFKLEPKVIAVLAYLIEQHPRVVSIDEFIDHIWQGSIVSEQPVQRCIAALRRVFKNDPDKIEYITTYSKKGYQLAVAPTQVQAHKAKLNLLHKKPKLHLIVAALSIVSLLSVSLLFKEPATTPVQTSNQLNFSLSKPFSLESAYQYDALPHWDNQHIAYVEKSGQQYQVKLRNKSNNEDWLLAESQKPWRIHQWSTHTSQLLASYQEAGQSYLYLFDVSLAQRNINYKTLLYQTTDTLNSASWLTTDKLLLSAKDKDWNYFVKTLSLAKAQTYSVSLPIEHLQNAQIAKAYQEKIAYVVPNSNGYWLRIDHNGKQLVEKHLPLAIKDLNWLADGSGITYLENNKIHYLGIDNTQFTYNFFSLSQLASVRFSPDAKQLYVNRAHQNYEIWQQQPNQIRTKVISSRYTDHAAVYAKNSESFAYISDRTGLPQIWLYNQGNNEQLTNFTEKHQLSHIKWGQDDQQLIFNFDNKIAHYSFTQTKHKPIQINTKNNVYTVGFSHNDNAFYYVEYTKDGAIYWRKELIIETVKPAERISIPNNSASYEYLGNIYFFNPANNEIGVWLNQQNRIEILGKVTAKKLYFIHIDADAAYYTLPESNNPSTVYKFNQLTRLHSQKYSLSTEDGWPSSMSSMGKLLLQKDISNEMDILVLE